MDVTTNKPKSFEPLKQASVTLPDSARVIKEVTVRYQNLDGSLDTRTISLENSVDWHLPIFVSQSYSAQAPRKEVVSRSKQTGYKNAAAFSEATFYQSGKKMRIKTADRLLRHFMMIKPHRIVMDFERVTDFRSKSKVINSAPYKAVRLGNHDGYYRAVIELDGQYQYKVGKEAGMILLEVY